LATEVALTGGVSIGPTSGNLVNGFAFWSTYRCSWLSDLGITSRERNNNALKLQKIIHAVRR
jgi:hypothetical protein